MYLYNNICKCLYVHIYVCIAEGGTVSLRDRAEVGKVPLDTYIHTDT